MGEKVGSGHHLDVDAPDERSDAAPRQKRGSISDWARRMPWRWLAPVVAAAIAVTFIAVGAYFTSQSGDLWFELAKSGMQLLAIVVLGGAVAAAFHSLDDRREDRRRLDEYRAGIAGDLLDAYHQIKAVRRTLRAIGFGPPFSGELSAEQKGDLRGQMDVLVDAQLTLEKDARLVEHQPSVFAPRIGPLIRRAEKHVNHVISEWEVHGVEFRPGADISSVMVPLIHLQSFLKSAHDDPQLKKKVSKPIVEAVRLIHSLRLPVSPAQLSEIAQDSGQPCGRVRRFT